MITTQNFQQRWTGWLSRPHDVIASRSRIAVNQGCSTDFHVVAYAQDNVIEDDKTVLLWLAEQKVLGKILPSLDQGNIGSCVGNGYARACQDLMLMEIALGEPEAWAGAGVCVEAIYGGSRHEIGADRIGNEDGSVGAWAAEWVQRGGVLFYLDYPSANLTDGYRIDRCRSWGKTGVPDALEPTAKLHPVTAVAAVRTPSEAWRLLGSGYPIPICSDIGFDSPLRDGICQRSGSWAHCMTLRGRFIHHRAGRVYVVQNSWGNYLKGGENTTKDREGNAIELPQGCFCVVESDLTAILRQDDSFSLSGFQGFPRREVLTWADL
jgi:hypothetical protein